MSATDWVAEKLASNENLTIVGRSPENFLIVRNEDGYSFMVAVLGIANVIGLPDVAPLFVEANKPQFLVNIPSRTLWSGAAIDRIHAEAAAFGTVGDVGAAASTGNAGSYRDRNMGFFINAIAQHSNVARVTYAFNRVFNVYRVDGTSVTVAVIDAYNMSAEDVRDARARFGHFDAIIKSSSYGSITSQAETAAQSIGARALKFGELMSWL